MDPVLDPAEDELERDVEAFRAWAAKHEQERVDELRVAAGQAGVPVRGRAMTVAWMTEAGDRVARTLWPEWGNGLNDDGPFDELRLRMERRLRERRADGDGPFVVVAIDSDDYAKWCEERGYEPTDRRSRASFVELERESGGGRRWPPGRNEPCWCGSERKYKRCCGALPADALARSAA